MTRWGGTATSIRGRSAKELDDGKYAYSWYENAPDVAGPKRRSTGTPPAPG
jgi:hypothetical protein